MPAPLKLNCVVTQFVLNGWSRVYRDDGGLGVGAWGLDEVDGDLGLRDRWGGWP